MSTSVEDGAITFVVDLSDLEPEEVRQILIAQSDEVFDAVMRADGVRAKWASTSFAMLVELAIAYEIAAMPNASGNPDSDEMAELAGEAFRRFRRYVGDRDGLSSEPARELIGAIVAQVHSGLAWRDDERRRASSSVLHEALDGAETAEEAVRYRAASLVNARRR
jgi:superfamily I DNA and RNA helicase